MDSLIDCVCLFRARVLCGALAKAMKDNFVHCRIAGLKTALASVKMMDVPQLATKIMPQAAILALDKSADVRELALTLLDASLERLRSFHEHATAAAKEAKELERRSSSGQPTTGDGVPNSSSNSSLLASPMLESWTSWSLQGLSKTLETEASGSDKRIGELTRTREIDSSRLGDSLSSGASLKAVESVSTPTVSSHGRNKSQREGADDWDWDDGPNQQFFDAREREDSAHGPSNIGGSQRSKGWDDDLDNALEFDDGDGNVWDDQSSRGTRSDEGQRSPRPLSSTYSSTGASRISGGLSSGGSSAVDLPPTKSTTTAKTVKTPKVAVKKLEFSKDDDWEDF